MLGIGEDGFVLNAEFQVELNPRLEEVVARGVPLYIVADFEPRRPRWYWFDEVVAQRSLTWRLSYHALTRQYRLSTGGAAPELRYAGRRAAHSVAHPRPAGGRAQCAEDRSRPTRHD
ncbi:MAG: DUF4390 domain-containing protein [Comamonadaceae bacterium]|nr:DUF4390 domain-containing protein [Comamonadaceae bacterium]